MQRLWIYYREGWKDMTKTHAEFLEELKIFCIEEAMKAIGPLECDVVYACDIIEMIEQFQAEQKQVSDEQ